MRLYHGTPCGAFERNRDVFALMHLCMSWAAYSARENRQRTGRPTASAVAHALTCQMLLLDNGAFSIWKLARKRCAPFRLNTAAIYDWMTSLWELRGGRDVAILLPDVIEGSEAENDALLLTCPEHLRPIAWPVWHANESLERLGRLANDYGRVAIGAAGEYVEVLGAAYCRRMDEVFNHREVSFRGVGLHMLRGLQLAGGPWPFESADSTDVGVNWSQTPHRLITAVSRWERRARATATTWQPTRHRICWASTAKANRKLLARQDAFWPVEPRQIVRRERTTRRKQTTTRDPKTHDQRQRALWSERTP